MTRKGKLKTAAIILLLLILSISGKMIWVGRATRGIGSFKTEREDILQRRDWLLSKVLVDPADLLSEMPSGIEGQFQGEWAMYSCSMLSAALVNISVLYPETLSDALPAVNSLIQMVLNCPTVPHPMGGDMGRTE